MKIKYLKHMKSRIGQRVLVRDIQEGEIIRVRYCSRFQYWRREATCFEMSRHKSKRIWTPFYTAFRVDSNKLCLNFHGEIIQ